MFVGPFVTLEISATDGDQANYDDDVVVENYQENEMKDDTFEYYYCYDYYCHDCYDDTAVVMVIIEHPLAMRTTRTMW